MVAVPGVVWVEGQWLAPAQRMAWGRGGGIERRRAIGLIGGIGRFDNNSTSSLLSRGMKMNFAALAPRHSAPKLRVRIIAAAAITLVAVLIGSAQAGPGVPLGRVALTAGATRTWVSGVGDDVNPCSRTAPCKTFAGAISKTAASGEIDGLDPGGFGSVTITGPITIDGSASGQASSLAAGTNGINVAAGPSDVVILRHLHVQGAGTGLIGINFISGKALYLEDVVIEGFTGKGIDMNFSTSGFLSVTNSTIRNNGNTAIRPRTTSGALKVTIANSTLEGDVNGVIGSDGTSTDIVNSVIDGMTGIGAGCTSAGTSCTLSAAHDQLDHNGTAIYSGGATSQVFMDSDLVVDNAAGIGTQSGGTVVSDQNNHFMTNGANGAPTAVGTTL